MRRERRRKRERGKRRRQPGGPKTEKEKERDEHPAGSTVLIGGLPPVGPSRVDLIAPAWR